MAQALAAIPLSSHVVVAFNVAGEAVSAGDPNHSALLGNVMGGVRGLPDNLYRNTAHSYTNLELRGALTLARRWYLQGVTFVDGGVFAPMGPYGDTLNADVAISSGIGLRLCRRRSPRGSRVDVGRRWTQKPVMFATFGLAQYF